MGLYTIDTVTTVHSRYTVEAADEAEAEMKLELGEFTTFDEIGSDDREILRVGVTPNLPKRAQRRGVHLPRP